MRLERLLFLLICILCTSHINGQFEIKTNALGLVNNNYNAQLELLLNDKSGLELEVSYRNTPWIIALTGSEIKNSAYRALVSYKYYIGSEDPSSGLYFGPTLRMRIANLENIPTILPATYTGTEINPETAKVLNNTVSLGITVGQKITFNNNFIIEYYGGIGYNAVNNINIRDNFSKELKDNLLTDTNSFTWPWDFRLGLSLGYRIWK